MSEDKSPQVLVLEAHEEFIQHIERGSLKIRSLSIITMAVGVLLLFSYVYQIVLPAATGITTIQVNLTDPLLVATESVLVVLVAIWLYVAVKDYLFTQRLGKQIKEARNQERELVQKYGLQESV